MSREEVGRSDVATQNKGQVLTQRDYSSSSIHQEQPEVQQLLDLFEIMNQGIICLSAEEELLMMNPSAQKLLSLTREELQDQVVMDVPWQAIQEDGTPFSRETHPVLLALRTGQHLAGISMGLFQAKEHTYRWITVEAIPQIHPGEQVPYQVFVIMQDYTLAKRTQKALDTLLAMTDALVQTMHTAPAETHEENADLVTEEQLAHIICHLLNCQRIGIALVDPDTESLYPIFVMGISPEHEYHWNNSLQGVLLGNFLGDPSLVSRLRDGEVLSLDIKVPLFTEQLSYKRVAPILLANDLVGILVIGYENASPHIAAHEHILIQAIARLASLGIMRIRMLHERDHAITELDGLREELTRTEKMRDNFISMMSREFRSALTGIQGFSELMRDTNLTLMEMREFAVDIHSDARRLVRMISDMLDLSRMEEERIELNPGWLDINAILVEAVSRVRPTTHQHLIRMQLARALPIFVGDREKLLYAVMHLLSNAIKYSPDGGEIIVTSALEENYVHVSVRDHGIGIPAIDMERIFERSARSDAGNIGGLHQGLPYVQDIVRLHSGQLWVESIPGAGSVFHMTIQFTTGC